MRKYFIVPSGSITNRIVNSSIHETSEEARWNVAGTHAIFEATIPIADVFLDFPGYCAGYLAAYLSENAIDWEVSGE